MDTSSKKIFLLIPIEKEENAIDTNIISLTFNDICDKQQNLDSSSPIICLFCKSILSSSSLIYESDEYKALFSQNNSEPHIDIKILDSGQKIWICEFCNHHNLLDKNFQKNPATNDIFYGKQINANENEEEKSEFPIKNNSDIDQNIIFCIDNSGSMAGTNLRCVKNAVLDQIETLTKKYPNKKVGLITFENEVLIYGDGSEKKSSLQEKLFNDFDGCLNAGTELSEKILKKSINESAEKLKKKLYKINTGGSTSLGPALLVSIGLIVNAKPGSMIVICTDGQANSGLGSLNEPDYELFYKKTGQLAKQKGIIISILTIKGGECNIDKLAILSDYTGGIVTRIKPTRIKKDFKKALDSGDLVGTEAKFKLLLHKSLCFRNASQDFMAKNNDISFQNSIYEKELGNITVSTSESFEFEFKTKDELNKINVIPELLKQVPIQVQIEFINLDGIKLLRVITINLDICADKNEVFKNPNVKIIGIKAANDSAKEAEKGNLILAKQKIIKWNRFLDNELFIINKDDSKFNKYYEITKKKNEQLEKQINKNISRKMKSRDQKIIKDISCIKNKEELRLENIVNSSEGSDEECYTKIKKFAKRRADSYEYFSSEGDSDHDQKNYIKGQSDSESDEKIKKNIKKNSSDSESKGNNSRKKKKIRNSDSDSNSDLKNKKNKRINSSGSESDKSDDSYAKRKKNNLNKKKIKQIYSDSDSNSDKKIKRLNINMYDSDDETLKKK